MGVMLCLFIVSNRTNLILQLIEIYRLFNNYSTDNDKGCFDQSLLGFWQINIEFFQKRCEVLSVFFHTLTTTPPSLLFILSSKENIGLTFEVRAFIRPVGAPESMEVIESIVLTSWPVAELSSAMVEVVRGPEIK